jgi:hypothetical protein
MKKLLVLCLISVLVIIFLVSAFGLQKMLTPAGNTQKNTNETLETKPLKANQTIQTCEPTTCQKLGRACGSMSDGCGETLNCGSCSNGQTCSSGGKCLNSTNGSASGGGSSSTGGGGSTVCITDCTGKECGDDGCGGSCGSCPNGRTCEANNVCSVCIKTTCQEIGEECGPWPDGCDGILDCGSCEESYSCRSGTCVYVPNLTTTQEVGEAWWISIFRGNWDALFNYSVDSNNDSISTECQNSIKATYASFAGAAYSFMIDDATTPCADATNLSLPTGCVYSHYSLNTSTIYGNFEGLLYFVDVGSEWRNQIDCIWYA